MFPEVEGDGGAGTRGGHWDDDAYTYEVMTGYLDSGYSIFNADGTPKFDIVADMTWETLDDLGYVIRPDYEDFAGYDGLG